MRGAGAGPARRRFRTVGGVLFLMRNRHLKVGLSYAAGRQVMTAESKCTSRANRPVRKRPSWSKSHQFAVNPGARNIAEAEREFATRSALPRVEKRQAQNINSVQGKVTGRENFLARRTTVRIDRIVRGIALDTESGNCELWSIRARSISAVASRPYSLDRRTRVPLPVHAAISGPWRNRRS